MTEYRHIPEEKDVTQEILTENAVSAQVRVANELGLHARPAAKLAQEAQKFESAILLVMNKQEVDAKSILDILTLAAGQGCQLTIQAGGEDAATALDRLERLFKNRFGEDK